MELYKQKVGKKHDTKKLDWSLLPLRQVESVIAVLGFGASKYSRDNWQYVAEHRDRYFSAAMRHISAWRHGEIKDKESNLPHLAHAICCLIFLLWFDDKKK